MAPEQTPHFGVPTTAHCLFCKNQFDIDLRVPKVLDCGHHFCLSCILIVSRAKPPQTLVTCFACKKTTKIYGGLEKLPMYVSALPMASYFGPNQIDAHLTTSESNVLSNNLHHHRALRENKGGTCYNTDGNGFCLNDWHYISEATEPGHFLTESFTTMPNIGVPEVATHMPIMTEGLRDQPALPWSWPDWCRSLETPPPEFKRNYLRQLGPMVCVTHNKLNDRWCDDCHNFICPSCSFTQPHSKVPFIDIHEIYTIWELQRCDNEQKVVQREIGFVTAINILPMMKEHFKGPEMQKFCDFFNFEVEKENCSKSKQTHDLSTLKKFFSGCKMAEGIKRSIQQINLHDDIPEIFLRGPNKTALDYYQVRKAVELMYHDRHSAGEKGMDVLVMTMSYLLQQRYRGFQETLKLEAAFKSWQGKNQTKSSKSNPQSGSSFELMESNENKDCVTADRQGSGCSGEHAAQSMDDLKYAANSNMTDSYLHVHPEMRRLIYFLDFEINTQPMGRVYIEVLPGVAPLMSANFAVLCLGTQAYSYEGCKVFQCWQSQSIITGDVAVNNGNGGKSILNDELFLPDVNDLPGDRGAVGMRRVSTNLGFHKGKVSSQFRIMLSSHPKRTGIFGHVVRGIEIIDEIAALDDGKGNPTKFAIISHCGRDE